MIKEPKVVRTFNREYSHVYICKHYAEMLYRNGHLPGNLNHDQIDDVYFCVDCFIHHTDDLDDTIIDVVEISKEKLKK